MVSKFNAPDFSVIIPVYREWETINPCLEHLAKLEGISEAEVIVVDGERGSTLDHITSKHYPFNLIPLISPTGRGVQLNRGAHAASGETLLFLHVDTTLPRRAFPLIRSALRSYPAGSFEMFIQTDNCWIKVISLFAAMRARLSRIPYGDQGLFMKRSTFYELGGFDDIPIMEDVVFMKKLKRKKVRIAILDTHIRTSDRRWIKEGIARATVRNWYIYLLFLCGVSPSNLERYYRPHRGDRC